MRCGYHREHIGRSAATGEGIARKLLSCCLAKQPKRSFLIDTPEVTPPGELYPFAIAGPEFG